MWNRNLIPAEIRSENAKFGKAKNWNWRVELMIPKFGKAKNWNQRVELIIPTEICAVTELKKYHAEVVGSAPVSVEETRTIEIYWWYLKRSYTSTIWPKRIKFYGIGLSITQQKPIQKVLHVWINNHAEVAVLWSWSIAMFWLLSTYVRSKTCASGLVYVLRARYLWGVSSSFIPI